MSNVELIPFAHHLIAPPMEFPFGLRSGGSIFGAPRNGGAFYRCHEGIDLYPYPMRSPPTTVLYLPSIGGSSSQSATLVVLELIGKL